MAISLRSLVLIASIQLMLLGLLPIRIFAQGLVNRGAPLRAQHNRGFSHEQRSRMSLSKSTGTGVEADSIVLKPTVKSDANHAYRNVVIFMHGLGDTATGWASTMPELRLTDTKFVLPTAPIRPITLAGNFKMNGWSDILAIAADAKEDTPGLDASAARVQAIIDQEKKAGTPANRIIVAGFSQGGALALHVGLRTKDRLAGVVACSSWLPLAAEYPAALGEGVKAGTPILQCHGDADEVVKWSWGKQSHDKMKQIGLDADFKSYGGLGHSASQAEMQAVSKFMQDQFDKA